MLSRISWCQPIKEICINARANRGFPRIRGALRAMIINKMSIITGQCPRFYASLPQTIGKGLGGSLQVKKIYRGGSGEKILGVVLDAVSGLVETK